MRQILEHAQAVADRALPGDRDVINKLCSDVTTMTEALCELRQTNKGTSPQVSLSQRVWFVTSSVSGLLNDSYIEPQCSCLTL